MRKTTKNEKMSLGSQLSTEPNYPEGGAGRDFLSALPGKRMAVTVTAEWLARY